MTVTRVKITYFSIIPFVQKMKKRAFKLIFAKHSSFSIQE